MLGRWIQVAAAVALAAGCRCIEPPDEAATPHPEAVGASDAAPVEMPSPDGAPEPLDAGAMPDAASPGDAGVSGEGAGELFGAAATRLGAMGYRVIIDDRSAADWLGTRRRQLAQAGLEVGARLRSMRVAHFIAVVPEVEGREKLYAEGWLEEWLFERDSVADVVAHGLRATRGQDLYGSFFFGKSPHVMYRRGDRILSARMRAWCWADRVGTIAVLLDFLCEGATPPLEEVVYWAGNRPRELAGDGGPTILIVPVDPER